MGSLIEELGSFEAVVDRTIEKLKQKNTKFDPKDFKDWMMLSKDYSERNYKKGLFFDAKLYYYCYLVYKKMRSGKNQHHMILVSGKIGKGKSVLGSQLAALIDPTLNMERICYVPPHLFRRFAKSNPADANLIDEGGNFFKAKNATTKISKDISQAFQLIRDLQQVLIICYDEPEKLDKDIIDKFDGIFIKTEDPSAYGDDRYKHYSAFNIKACDRIKPLLKKKVPITDPNILKHVSWKGSNTKEMPVVNNFNESTYRSEKRRYLRDHMNLLADRWAEEYESIDKDKETRDRPMQVNDGWVRATRFRKEKEITYDTQKAWANKGLIEEKKIGRTLYCREP